MFILVVELLYLKPTKPED